MYSNAYVPSCTDNQVRVDSLLSLVQSIHKYLLLSCVHLHDIPPYWREVIGVENQGLLRCGRNQGRKSRKENVIKN